MEKKSIIISLLALGVLFMVFIRNPFNSNEIVDFSADIKPILNKNCIACHGGVKKNAGFSLLFEEEAFEKTESGKPAIIPGNASGSEFIKRLHETDPELRMPYEHAKLSDKDIDLLTRWINQGAKWGKHWAYSLPEQVAVPIIAEKASFSITNTPNFIKNDIDNFIARRLEEEQLQPNEAADKYTIIRRAALDLTGLPPKTELVGAFTSGNLSYESMLDSLLSKKGYGEKWASWWLDLARYADTKGYERDAGRTMWQYRDWVIKAFNKDMPYDQFTIEQLAGDLLLNPTKDQLIATAFHRNTMNNDEGGTEDEEYRVSAVLNRTNTTFEVWQSTTLGCVQCHSHPYDPFKQKEYYNLMSFFNNSRDEDTWDEEPNLKFYDEKQSEEIEEIKQWISTNVSEKIASNYTNFLTFTEPTYQVHKCENFVNGELADTKWLALWNNGHAEMKNVNTHGANFMYLKYTSNLDGTLMTIRKEHSEGDILARFKIDKTKGRIIRKIPFKTVDGMVDLYIEVSNNSIAPQVSTCMITWFAFLEDLPETPKSDAINNSFLKLLNADVPKLPIMVENPSYMKRETQRFERGNWLVKADTVQPKTPETLNPWEGDFSNDRLGLAQWMVSEKNPLTARTLVNRVWHQIYGRGIVTTLEDMGSQSDPPSHPALLDWLSLRFMNENNWSIKALIKDIMMSGTYRQSSITNTEAFEKDPGNKFYARSARMRLSAEQIRDQALSVSGILSDKMYGPGVMPPQPDGVWQTVYSNEKWIESKGEDRYRRAVYTYLKRTSPYPSFVTFDAGSREVCTIRRTVTNTPLQALVTLNDPVYLEAAYHLAKYMDGEDLEKGIAKGYKKLLFSEIGPSKLNTFKELYQHSVIDFKENKEATQAFLSFDDHPTPNMAALMVVANAMLNLDEFLTKS